MLIIIIGLARIAAGVPDTVRDLSGEKQAQAPAAFLVPHLTFPILPFNFSQRAKIIISL